MRKLLWLGLLSLLGHAHLVQAQPSLETAQLRRSLLQVAAACSSAAASRTLAEVAPLARVRLPLTLARVYRACDRLDAALDVLAAVLAAPEGFSPSVVAEARTDHGRRSCAEGSATA